MMVLVSYDVKTTTPEGKRRLRRVAKACQDHGQRVQFSVFECLVDPEHWARLRLQLLQHYLPEEDSLRFYFLGSNWHSKVEHHGAKSVPDPEGPLIV